MTSKKKKFLIFRIPNKLFFFLQFSDCFLLTFKETTGKNVSNKVPTKNNLIPERNACCVHPCMHFTRKNVHRKKEKLKKSIHSSIYLEFKTIHYGLILLLNRSIFFFFVFGT